jgi:hypothetical protein
MWPGEEGPDTEAETVERGPPPAVVAFLTILFPPAFAYFLFTKLCHLLAPLVPDAGPYAAADALVLGPTGDAQEAAHEERLDSLVRWAWRSALMGFFLLPPLLLTLYSIYLLARYWRARRTANRPRDRWALWTLGLNLLAALCLGILLAVITASLYDRVWHGPSTIGPPERRSLPYLGH